MRPDISILNRLVKAKHMTEAKARSLAQLAYVEIPNVGEADTPEPTTEWELYFASEEKVGFWTEDFLHHEFVVKLGEIVYAHIEVVDDYHFNIAYTLDRGGNSVLNWYELRCTSLHKGGTEFTTEKPIYNGIPIHTHGETDKFVEGYVLLLTTLLRHCQTFTRFNNERDRFAVAATPERRKKGDVFNRKDRLNNHAGPSIVYLDKMPPYTENGTEVSGLGTTIKPHQRRGHFKTLRHERYKDHPKYMILQGIYIKPIWVGDRSRIVNGTIYKLFEDTEMGKQLQPTYIV